MGEAPDGWPLDAAALRIMAAVRDADAPSPIACCCPFPRDTCPFCVLILRCQACSIGALLFLSESNVPAFVVAARALVDDIERDDRDVQLSPAYQHLRAALAAVEPPAEKR